MSKEFPYEDIIDLPPYISKKHPQPTMMERAARFAPFAAITGYEEMVLEEARVTEERMDLDEDTLATLNERLNWIKRILSEEPKVRITYFQPDAKKAGGSYLSAEGIVKQIHEFEHLLILTDGRKIPIDEISNIEGEIFDHL